MILSKLSSREFLEIYNTREPHHSQKWAIWRPFSWVGDEFVQIFMSRVFFRSIVQKNHTHQRSELSGDLFHEWAMISSKFSCREFLEIYGTKSHNNYRSELSGDLFLELVLISSKVSTREFLEIYNTREPHHSQKWAIWRPFSRIIVDFVQIFMSRVSWDL